MEGHKTADDDKSPKGDHMGMEQVGDIASRSGIASSLISSTGSEEVQTPEALHPCPDCGAEMRPRRTRGQAPGEEPTFFCSTCYEAAQREKALSEFVSGIGDWSIEKCRRAGMASKELKARLDGVPLEIKRRLPSDDVKRLLAGDVGSHGFGLGSSGTGGGKTMAFAAMLREAVGNRAVQKRRDSERAYWDDFEKERWIVWRSWPSEVAWFRMNATSDAFPLEVEDLLEAPVLFLDDVGSERIKGSYVEDFAASQLDLVVDTRHREERPIFYTTNLDEAGLIGLYGARLVSRLCGENPLIFFIEGLPDLRMAK